MVSFFNIGKAEHLLELLEVAPELGDDVGQLCVQRRDRGGGNLSARVQLRQR